MRSESRCTDGENAEDYCDRQTQPAEWGIGSGGSKKPGQCSLPHPGVCHPMKEIDQ